MNDILGYNRDIKTDSLISGNNVAIDFGYGRVALMDNATLSYGHSVQTINEVGSNAVYFVNGQPTGSLTTSVLVGPEGFFGVFLKGGTACGTLKTFNFNIIDGGCDTAQYNITSNKNIKLEGVKPTRFGVSINANELRVVQTADFMVGKVSVN